jgi:ubiquinone/menaquinone biosynthesis C-methylase UbiE
MGHSDLFMELLERRSAARNAAHLLPLLRPGMDLLDLGCGPGLITLGLARAVYPGKATGLDRDGEQVGTARANARLEGVENVCFVPGESLDLPFPGGSLDVVHCHAFLMHSPRIREQLAEIVRVLKPGGILSSRDMDVPASFISPVRDDNQGMWDMLGEVVRQEGGDPWMGRHLKTFFRNAGLEDVETGFGADCFTSPEEVEFLAGFLVESGLSPELMARTGSSPGDFGRWREQVERWSRHPGAVGCFHFGHAVGRKPWKDPNAARRANPATGWGIPAR